MAEIDTSKTVSELEIDGVNVQLAGSNLNSGLMEGTFQSCQNKSSGYGYIMSGTVSLNSRLYEYLGHSSSMLYLSSSNIYVQNMESIDIGYLNGDFEFVSVGTGSRDSMTINATFNEQPIPEQHGIFVFIRDNIENKIYLACNYYSGNTTESITIEKSEKITLSNSISCILRTYGMTSPTEIPAGSSSKVCISYPAWKFYLVNDSNIRSNTECFGITIS